MQTNTYLFFSGEARAAMHFYQKILGGKLEVMTYGEAMHEQFTEDRDNLIHSALTFDGGAIMAADEPGSEESKKKSGFSVTVVCDTAEEARRIFNALADGGNIVAPMEKTFFSEAFGMLQDRFGVPWMVNTMAR